MLAYQKDRDLFPCPPYQESKALSRTKTPRKTQRKVMDKWILREQRNTTPQVNTLPQTNRWPVKIDGWKMNFLLRTGNFSRGYVAKLGGEFADHLCQLDGPVFAVLLTPQFSLWFRKGTFAENGNCLLWDLSWGIKAAGKYPIWEACHCAIRRLSYPKEQQGVHECRCLQYRIHLWKQPSIL